MAIDAFVVVRSGGKTIVWSGYPTTEETPHITFATDREEDLICVLRPNLGMCNDDWETFSTAPPSGEEDR